MRYLLIFWALPMGIFWGWYGLSYHDISFGYAFLSRRANDFFFALYGQVLGIEPAAIPALAARACVVDSFLLAGILAFRRRRRIAAWMRSRRAAYGPDGEPAAGARNLSSAP